MRKTIVYLTIVNVPKNRFYRFIFRSTGNEIEDNKITPPESSIKKHK